ncbi:MAG TPA: 2Fe-2S iron-sulfur cluster-binding protein [Myxococcota bacterium]|nr:2Fe-2S iron-sulfur cluster-binding protein [Myxococcota bacterium]HRY95013.1 2Fe-2S iron-sulfur cluster-binding protein [Myxococcota bacterium]HSA21619.1 2Fe-2S iron-sulfur cluster-binding protein [Myxococcota bacterium]
MSHEDTPKGAKITFQVDGRACEGFHHESLLGALRRLGFEVPSLCFHEAVSTYGACRLCLVEVQKGRKSRITTSCNFPVTAGLQVRLDTPAVQQNRKIVFQLLLAKAPASPEVRALAAEYGVHSTPYKVSEEAKDNKCILCGLCARVCTEVVGANAIAFSGRGSHKDMVAPYDEAAEACIGCGACVEVCPTHCIGLRETPEIRTIEKWHRDLPLQKCEKCGRPFAPTFQLMTLGKRVGMKLSDFKVCNDCR